MTHPSMTCAQLDRQLSEFLEETLSDSNVADIELHLASCARCRSLVDDLSAITRSASVLGPLMPTRDLWPEISTKIESRTVVALPSSRRSSRLQMFGVAAGLVAATVLITLQVSKPTAPASPEVVTAAAPVESAVIAQPVAPTSAGSARIVAARPEARATLSTEIDQLRGAVEEADEVLDPATLAILRASIRTIDSAIVEAKAALRRDPGSPFLSQQLDRSLERKLGLMRQATLFGAKL